MEGLKIGDVHTTIRLIFMTNNSLMYKIWITVLFLLLMFKVRYVVMRNSLNRINDKHCLQFTPRSWHPFVFILQTFGFYFVGCEFYMELKDASRIRQNIFAEVYIS
jgi:hypothetical protein